MDSEYGGGWATSSFSEANIRRGFMRKVYSILSLQLLVTMALMGFFFIQPVREYATKSGQWMFIVAALASFACLIALACFENVRRKAPGNFICLGVFTILEGVMLGCAVARYDADEVMIAIGATTVLVLGLTVFALQTKIDFTTWGAALWLCCLALFIFGLCRWFFPYSKTLNLIYACIGALIFSMYIIFDTQLMMGGKHKYALDPEEYIFASLNLYLDVINLFLMILQIIHNSRN